MIAPPLDGIQILSFEQYGAGPYGTQQLADLGAEVIKIEPAGSSGDFARAVGPYFTDNSSSKGFSGNAASSKYTEDTEQPSTSDEPATDSSIFFQSFNRNKKSLTLDITSETGLEIFHRLVANADAVANNLRGDVPEKLGITYDDLKKTNPAIVCAHCSAYGRTGPRKNWPGFDYLMQAEAGYFQLCGEPDSPPTRFGLSLVDYMSGQNLALGLLSAVIAARKNGIGRDVDVNLFDTAMFNLSYVGNWVLNTDFKHQRIPRSAHPSLAPCQLYKTADGWIYVMLVKAAFWPPFCELIGQPDLIDDERFCNYDVRRKHRDVLTEILDHALSEKTTAQWLEIFGGKIPVAPVLNPEQALNNPFFKQRASVQDLKDNHNNPLKLLAPCIDAGIERSNDSASPSLGQHTDEILQSIGYEQKDINQLREQNWI